MCIQAHHPRGLQPPSEGTRIVAAVNLLNPLQSRSLNPPVLLSQPSLRGQPIARCHLRDPSACVCTGRLPSGVHHRDRRTALQCAAALPPRQEHHKGLPRLLIAPTCWRRSQVQILPHVPERSRSCPQDKERGERSTPRHPQGRVHCVGQRSGCGKVSCSSSSGRIAECSRAACISSVHSRAPQHNRRKTMLVTAATAKAAWEARATTTASRSPECKAAKG
mmetsp:Transcript_16049/g.38117  ORF Transcript_16049/g.38117 Transcript_16049/m.38117 type:complete len:221 (+) Transcript_16049:1477-2139(+)